MSKARKKAPNVKNCVIYARFSSERQRDESIEDQVRVCRMFAKGQGMKVVDVYADRAVSGRTADREAFQRMVADSANGRFGTVVVYKLDRFARDRFDAALYRHMLRDNGVSLVSAMEQIPDTPEGTILEAVIEGFNEYYSRNLSQNVMRGMTGNARKCKANGVAVYGYDIDGNGCYQVNPRQAAYVRRAFSAAATCSMTRTETVRMLNDAGERTSRGSKWTLNSLRDMLRNPKYMGDYVWGEVTVEGGMPAIVHRSTWADANRALKDYKPHTAFYRLTGRLFHETGEPYRGMSATGGSGKTYYYYAARIDGKELRLRRDDVESSVMDIVRRTLRSEGVADAIAELSVEAYRKRRGSGEREAAERQLSEIDKAMGRILKAIEAGIIPDGTKERLDALKERKAALEASIERMPGDDCPSVEEVARQVRERLADFRPDQTLSELVGTVKVSRKGEGFMLTVELPWLPGLPLSEENRNAVSAGSCVDGEVINGRLVHSGCELVVLGNVIYLRGPFVRWSLAVL